MIRGAGVLVDAVFGIGLNAPLRQPAAAAVRWMNESPAPVVAADVPSGVSADTGVILGEAVRAAETVTFTLAKPGLVTGAGALCCGKLTVAGIGIPDALVDAIEARTMVTTPELVRAWLPPRPADGHKGTFGKCYLLCGSVGYTGAPVLAAEGAVRSGAGLVFLGVPEEAYLPVACRCREAMPHPLPSRNGMLDVPAEAEVLRRLENATAALIGPGLGRTPEADQVVRGVLNGTELPLVLDADGINAAAGHKDIWARPRRVPLVLTPHDGEFARLGGALTEDRLGTARTFAREHGCVLLLKGHRTIVAAPDGRVCVNPTGNAGMAKGGSGDVLSGIVVSLLAQGMPPFEAAAAAAWIHGRAGDLCEQKLTQRGMTPSDLIAMLPDVWMELE